MKGTTFGLVIIGLMIVGGINTGLHIRDTHGLASYDKAIIHQAQLCSMDDDLANTLACKRVALLMDQ